MTWKSTLIEMDKVVVELRAQLSIAALDRLQALLPADVGKRAQHPITVGIRELVGSAKQLLQGRAVARNNPAWMPILEASVEEAFADLEMEIAKQLRELTSDQLV